MAFLMRVPYVIYHSGSLPNKKLDHYSLWLMHPGNRSERLGRGIEVQYLAKKIIVMGQPGLKNWKKSET